MGKLLTIIICMLAVQNAAAQDKNDAIWKDINGVRDVTLDSLEKANQVRPVSGSSRKGDNPVLFLVGNSTMRNGTLGNGNNGQWGWGYYAHLFFDEKQITVENHALGGTSPRTFYNKLWKPVLEGMRPGDYVVLELGHNDNGPIDENRARSSYKTSKSNGGQYDKFLLEDSTVVTVKEDGRQEKVFTFGGYMRRFVNEARAKGAIPILLTLTPRNAYEQDDTNRVDRKLTSFTPWIKAMAEELSTPLIDLNDISATKLEKYGKHKADYHFFGDKIHSSAFGAKMNAASFAEGLDACQHPQVANLKQFLKADMVHPKTVIEKYPNWVTTKPTKKANGKKKKPRVFLAGDSTGKNADKDPNGMWGWGSQAASVFDGDKCTFVNCAMAGRSTRTFLKEGRWDDIYNSLEPGDYVLIQFGHNDMSGIDKPKFRGVIPVAQDSCHVYRMEDDGSYEVVYSFGWYLKKFIEDTREKGATPILLSLTPRNEWPNGKVERRNDFFGKLYRQVVEQTGVDFIDIHNITADALDKMGKEKAAAMFNHDHTHTSLAGAQLNCQSLAKGLKAIKSPLRKCLK
jgi:lysophospholipase L1-like esterase